MEESNYKISLTAGEEEEAIALVTSPKATSNPNVTTKGLAVPAVGSVKGRCRTPRQTLRGMAAIENFAFSG